MTIDWAAFTPWSALTGGVIIGVATAMFLLLNGRVAGISGIVGGLVGPSALHAAGLIRPRERPFGLMRPARGDLGWRIAFVAGLIGAPFAYALAAALPALRIDAGYGALVVAGLLVGVGTRYGAGCTSGHGVCGLSRLSPRSLVATAAFMTAGFATVFVVRHVLAR